LAIPNIDGVLARKYVMRKFSRVMQTSWYNYFTLTHEKTYRDAIGQFGVGVSASKVILWVSSTMHQETSVMVEVTGLHSKPENASSHIDETDYIQCQCEKLIVHQKCTSLDSR